MPAARFTASKLGFRQPARVDPAVTTFGFQLTDQHISEGEEHSR